MIHGSTDHSGDVTGSEHVFGVQREKHSCHAEEDEVAEGDVHCCLATPVSRWHQTRDSQSRAALNLSKKKKRNQRNKQDGASLVTPAIHGKLKKKLLIVPSNHLSVLCVVHCKIRWHSSCQHSQYDSLNVHQSVGSRIWNLLRGHNSLYVIVSLKRHGSSPVSSDSRNQTVWSRSGFVPCHSDLAAARCSVC